MKYLMMLVISLGLVGCGSSDSAGGDSGGDEISTKFSYSDVRVLKGEAVTISPAWVGKNAPESMYSIDPALPAGLSIDENTGEITGAHATSKIATPHTVTATPPDGADGISAKILVIVFETRPADKAELITDIATEITANGDTADLSIVDTSLIEDMSELFKDNATFNGDVSKWDTSKVTNIDAMFNNATVFNGDISKWVTSKVTNMNGMFLGAKAFNSDISGWETGEVTTMKSMFNSAVFNGDISKWDTSKVKAMAAMFNLATVFNGDISGWDTSKVTDMSNMFLGASVFNSDISGWKTGKVTTMNSMFYRATVFNQDLSGWDVLKVTDRAYFATEAAVFEALTDKHPNFLD